MLNTLMSIVYFVIMVAVLIGVIALLKKFVFSKIRINKYIPLGVSVVGLLAQFFFKIENVYINGGITILVVIFFYWFYDIHQTGGPKKGAKSSKKVVIKPKAKPNRVKNEK